MYDQLSGRTWILLWVITFASLGIFMWLVYYGAMGRSEQRYFYLDVPGSMELPHLDSAEFVIYQVFDKSGDSKEDLRPGGFNRLSFSLVPLNGDEKIEVKPVSRPSRFVIRRMVCEAVYEFKVDKAGGYRINADYASDQTGGTYRVAIGQSYYQRTLQSFMLGLVVLVVGGILVTIIFYRSGILKQQANLSE